MFPWWELSLASLALPLLHTHHALHLQENMPFGLFGSSVFDKLTTIWRKEDKFKGKGREGWGAGVQLRRKV